VVGLSYSIVMRMRSTDLEGRYASEERRPLMNLLAICAGAAVAPDWLVTSVRKVPRLFRQLAIALEWLQLI